ncbi:MAG TPA: class I SAM-dependent methyltransferase [Usitatibacter sp.]|jgi:SAM-dependent methyltransferase|nr:class I SAM-dependent methyltransferase [Usitatibacter sp.]
MTKRDTDKDWARIAERDPFWGVLSQERYHKDKMSKARVAEFMATGEKFVADILGLVRHHLDPEIRLRRVLDFGCGVGRLLIPFARYSEQAVGVDVAPKMLELCRGNAKLAGVTNIRLVLGDDELKGAQGEFDFVNAFIVLQHIPPERGMRLVRRLIERVRIGGVASLQVTYAKARGLMQHEVPAAQFYRRDGATMTDLVESDSTPPEGTIQMYDYDLNHFFALVSRYSGHPVIVLPTGDDGHLGVHCIFARAR